MCHGMNWWKSKKKTKEASPDVIRTLTAREYEAKAVPEDKVEEKELIPAA
jgi:hypothetical protein